MAAPPAMMLEQTAVLVLVLFHQHCHRLALVDDIHGQEFDRSVADDFDTRMRHVDVRGTSRDGQLAIAAVTLFLAAHVTVTTLTLYPRPAMADCGSSNC
jgi:hypothetical protein